MKKDKKPGLSLEEMEKPSVKPGNLLVKIEACSICGTDIHLYSSSNMMDSWNVSLPLIIGVEESLKAADMLKEDGMSAEVIDLRTLVPLDMETVSGSVKKTGKAIVTSQEVEQSGFMCEVITSMQEQCFDWLDAPIQRLGAPNGIPPSAQNLEKLFLSDAEKLVKLIKEI